MRIRSAPRTVSSSSIWVARSSALAAASAIRPRLSFAAMKPMPNAIACHTIMVPSESSTKRTRASEPNVSLPASGTSTVIASSTFCAAIQRRPLRSGSSTPNCALIKYNRVCG